MANKQDTQESIEARCRKRARILMWCMLGTAAAGTAAGVIYKTLADRKAIKAVADSKDWTTVDDVKRRGIIPRSSYVIQTRQLPESSYSKIKQLIRRWAGADRTNGAQMSFNVANSRGLPIFYFGHDKNRVNERIVKHEAGHYRSMMARNRPEDYVNELKSAKKRAGGWLDLFRLGRTHDSRGRRTLVGLEQEAWDRGGISADDPIRRAAVGTYKADAAVKSLNRYMKLTAVASIVPGAYGYISNAEDEDEKKLPKRVKDTLKGADWAIIK